MSRTHPKQLAPTSPPFNRSYVRRFSGVPDDKPEGSLVELYQRREKLARRHHRSWSFGAQKLLGNKRARRQKSPKTRRVETIREENFSSRRILPSRAHRVVRLHQSFSKQNSSARKHCRAEQAKLAKKIQSSLSLVFRWQSEKLQSYMLNTTLHGHISITQYYRARHIAFFNDSHITRAKRLDSRKKRRALARTARAPVRNVWYARMDSLLHEMYHCICLHFIRMSAMNVKGKRER